MGGEFALEVRSALGFAVNLARRPIGQQFQDAIDEDRNVIGRERDRSALRQHRRER